MVVALEQEGTWGAREPLTWRRSSSFHGASSGDHDVTALDDFSSSVPGMSSKPRPVCVRSAFPDGCLSLDYILVRSEMRSS